MKLGFSIATGSPDFDEAMSFVYREFEPLFDAFQSVDVVSPTCTGVLLGITDEKKESYFRISPNKRGFFHVIAGCPATSDQSLLKRAVFERLLKTVRACPLHPQDRSAFEALFEDWRRENLPA